MLSILISSTFNDMQGERDVIRSRVAPALRRIAAQYGQSVRLIDLRWGVNTADMSEEEASQKVLETCLNEIDRCDGYMICLLGNRYGWVPDYTKVTTLKEHGIHLQHPVSVTELEIQYGILRRNRGERSVIFLRDEVTDLPPTLLSQYNDPPEDGRMASLKTKLESLPEGSCEHYSLAYGEDGEFRGINSFAERLIERATQLLRSVLGGEETLSEEESLKRTFDHMVEEHGDTYLPDPAVEGAVSSFAAGSSAILILQGEEGSGRTALISHLTKSPPKGVQVIPFFCGEQHTGRHILNYFIHRLNKDGDRITLGPESPQIELEECFAEVIAHWDEPLWLAVDGLELLGGDGDTRLSWLPHHLPHNVRFVLTTVKEDRACNQLGESFYAEYFHMPPMADTLAFLRAGLAAAGKAVPEEILAQIGEHPLSCNYLFCDMVIRMLMLMGRHDFAVMNRDGGGIEAINAYILGKIKDLPKTMEEMAFLFLYDCGEQVTPGNTARFLSAIAQAPMGLRAQDLQALFPEEWDEAEFSYFTAFLDGFLVCDDSGCYSFPSVLMKKACFRVGEADLLPKIASYFATLPDNDPVKVGSALPMFLLCKMSEEAGNLILNNPDRKGLYLQLWNLLTHVRGEVSALLGCDDVLGLFLAEGMDLCEDRVRLTVLCDILKTRTPPKDKNLHRAMLLGLARLQIRCEDKRGAYQTLSTLLPLEEDPLSVAKTGMRLVECSFVDKREDVAVIAERLQKGLRSFLEAETLSPGDTLLLYKGMFYRYVLALQDAVGVELHGIHSYRDFAEKRRGRSAWAYVDTLSKIRWTSFLRGDAVAEVLPILIDMCDLGERIRSRIIARNEFNLSYAWLFLDLLRVMDNADPSGEAYEKGLSAEEACLLTEFRARRTALITGAHSAVLTALKGRYDAPMLKILAHLQIRLATASDQEEQCRQWLEQSTRILWRYFSGEPLSDFAEELEDALSALAEYAFKPEDLTAYEDTLEKWGSVALAIKRHDIRIANEECHRYPDEIHGAALERARRGMGEIWSEYSQRLWLRELYRFKSNVDLVLSLYEGNLRYEIQTALPTEVINIRTALVLVKKITELEPCFEDQSLTDLYRRTLPVAFHSLLATALKVILLSEQTLVEDGKDVLTSPEFYYSKTAAFVEDYIRRCRERNLDIAPDTLLRLSFRLAQLKLKALPYSDGEREQELGEILTLLETLADRIPSEPIPSDWLMDEVSVDSVRRLQCRAYLLLGDLCYGEEDVQNAVVCYKQVCTLCGALYAGGTASRAQTQMAAGYLRHVLPPLLACYEQMGTEAEYKALWDLVCPILGE